jgi:signal transduction histidine kinase/ActR/RegA family two-component response regulator
MGDGRNGPVHGLAGRESGGRERRRLPAWWAVCLALFAVPLAAARLPADASSWPVTATAGFWFDASGEAGPAEAMVSPFQPLGNPNFGNRHGALWLRLDIDNPGPPVERILRVGPAMLAQVDLWQPGTAPPSRQSSGLRVPQDQRAMPGRFALFPVHFPAGTSTLFLRLASPSKLNPDLSLWEPAALQRRGDGFEVRTALMLGGLLMTAQMSLFYALWMREFIWAAFGGGILSYVIYQACYEGFAALWLWPGQPSLSYIVLPTTAALTQALLAIFLLGFIPMGQLHPAWRLLWSLPATTALGLCAVFLVDYRIGMPIIEAVGVACSVSLPLLSLAAWRAGFRPARYALMSFGLIYAATLLRVGMLFGWWPKVYMADLWLMPLSGVLASSLLLLALIEQLCELRMAQARSMADLAAARDAAHRANRSKSLLLARVSHDLRTPLQALAGYLDLARRENPGGALGRYLEVIGNSGRNMLGLIEELLQFARGEEGRLVVDARPTLLQAFVRDIASQGEMLARSQDNRFVLDIDLPEAVAEIDAERLHSVLMNLLGNACRMTHGGTVALLVSGRTEEGQVLLRFDVRDTGPGIAAEDQERIFEAFEHGRSGPRSTGLGLAIARQLVQLMGGELRVDSVLGQGATFTVRLSAAVAQEADVLPAATFRAPFGYEGPVRTLLVVDDVAENRVFLQDLLTGMDFDVVLASGVADGREALAATPVDGVIVDQYLLDGDGWELLDAAKTRNPALPVILLSAAPPAPPADRASAWTFDAELLKPVKIAQLTQALGARLGLAWHDETAAPPAPAAVQQPPAEPVAMADLQSLRQAAHEGRLFEVEDWIECRRQRPEEREFLERLVPLVAVGRLAAVVDLVDRRLEDSSAKTRGAGSPLR